MPRGTPQEIAGFMIRDYYITIASPYMGRVPLDCHDWILIDTAVELENEAISQTAFGRSGRSKRV